MTKKTSYGEINWDEHLFKHNNGMQACSICGYRIPKNIQRMRYERHGYQQSSVFTVCALCLVQIAKRIDKKSVKKLMEARFVEQL